VLTLAKQNTLFMLTVSKILEAKSSRVYAVTPENTVYEALQLMSAKDIGAVVVLNGETLSGIFSERDYARKIVLKGLLSKDTKVAEVMTSNVISIDAEMNIFECMELMSEKRIRHLPVVDGDKVSGMITIGDVVNAIIKSQATEINSLRNYISGGAYGG
jgi:CBS domain-containing protein